MENGKKMFHKDERRAYFVKTSVISVFCDSHVSSRHSDVFPVYTEISIHHFHRFADKTHLLPGNASRLGNDT